MTDHLSTKFEVKSADDDSGTFTAYGNVFGIIDGAGDITVNGAFTNTIEEHKSNGTMPKLLAQHGHTTMPIGVITDMVEDEKGLRFEGKFALETQAGAEAYALVKMGAIDEFSVGYIVRNFERNIVDGKSVRQLLDLNVKEISLVTFACNPESKIEEIKSAVENGNQVTPRMVQKALQESGLSKRQSEKAINSMSKPEEIKQDANVSEETETKEHNVSVEQETKNDAETIVAEQPEANIDKKADYWMEHTLKQPVLSLSCFQEVFYYLPPATHVKLLEIAEEGRKAQAMALGLVEEEEVEVKSEEVEVEEVEEETETKEDETEETEDKEVETKSDELVLSQETVAGWFNTQE